MKKYVAIFLALLLAFCFVGCNSKNYEKYTSFVSDETNDGYNAPVEVNYWTGEYFKKKHMKSKSCVVLGNSYHGSYNSSIVNTWNSYTTDIYVDENYIEFGLRNDNGKLAYINFMNADFLDTQPYLSDVSDPYETAISLAEEIAGEYVDNIADYTQIVEEPVTRYIERDGVTYEITYFTVTFVKKINGYLSSDYIAVKVTSKGTLALISMGDIGAFSNAVIDFEKEPMEQSISNKVESGYKDSKLSVKKFNIEEQKIVLTPDGYICMCSRIAIEGVNDSNIEAKTETVILTILGKK